MSHRLSAPAMLMTMHFLATRQNKHLSSMESTLTEFNARFRQRRSLSHIFGEKFTCNEMFNFKFTEMFLKICIGV